MNRNNSIILILLLALFSACGGKKASTRTSLVLGGVIDSIAGQAGGTMIYGRQISGGQDKFAIKLPYSEDLELTNGLWNFAVVSWDGNSASRIMEGQTRCGIQEVELLGGDQTVSMALSKANCKAQFFGDDKSKEVSGEPKVFLPAGCSLADEKDGSVGDSDCKNSVGVSYTVELPQKLPGGGIAPGLVSRCIVEDTSSGVPQLTRSDSQLRVPMFFPFGFDDPLIKLTLFEDAACTSSPQVTTIANPLAGSASRAIELDNDVTGFTIFNVLFVHNPVCEGSFATSGAPFDIDLGGGGNDYVLCNPTQLTWIQGNDLTGKYFLESDLDYFGIGPITAPIISSPFTGVFDGRGHFVYDLDMDNTANPNFGMFSDISGRVENLKIVGADLDVTNDRSNVGVLAGNLSGSGLIQNVELSNINITVNGSTAGSAVGALVGRVVNTAGGGGVRNIFAEDITIDAVGYKDVGSVIGLIDGANSRVEDINVDFVVMDFDNVAAPCLGGVFGRARNSAFARNISIIDIYIGELGTPAGGAARTNIGGIAGCVANGSTLESARVEFGEIYTNSSNIGGAVGFVDPISGTPLHVYIKDVLSAVDTIAGLENIGGVIGDAQGSAAASLKMERTRYIGPDGLGFIDCTNKCSGLVASLGGTGTTHTVDQSWVKNVTITTYGSTGTKAGGLFATGQDAIITEVFVEDTDIVADVSANPHTLGGLYADSAGVFSITDAYALDVTVSGDFVGDDGLITSNATGDNLVRIFTVGSASFGDYSLGTPATANVSNLFSTVAGRVVTGSLLSVIEDSTTLSTAGFTAAIWNNLSATGPKSFEFEKPYDLFANSGLGNERDPYLVSSEDAWNAVGDDPRFMGKSFKLNSDLDFTSMSFIPFGSNTNPFWGNLAGNDFAISNISEVSCAAPFGIISVISTDATNTDADFARNVGVNSTPGSGSLYLFDNTFNCNDGNVGTLAGEIRDRTGAAVDDQRYAIKVKDIIIDNSDVSTSGNSPAGSVGGVAGFTDLNNNGTEFKNISIYNSMIVADSLTYHSGGLFGRLVSTSTPAPTNQGRMESLRSIDNTVNAAAGVIGVGGVFGYFGAKHIEVRKIIADSSVSGDDEVGGVVGSQMDGRISEAVSIGDVTGTTDVGGFVGYLGLAGAEINGSYSTASVTATTSGSGFVGANITGSIIKNSWYDPTSLSGSATLSPPNDIDGAGSKLVMVGSDTVRANLVQATLAQLQDDPVFFGNNFVSVDPFIFSAGDYPRPYFEIFPQFFVD